MVAETETDPAVKAEAQIDKDAQTTSTARWVIAAQQKYGYLAGFIKHPEIGPLLQQAATNGWTAETLQGELYKTDWWTKTGAVARQFALLESSDPAEAQRQIDHQYKNLRLLASQQGFTLPEAAIRKVARASLVLGFDENLTREALFASVQWKPTAQPTGLAGQQSAAIKARAAAYGVAVGDEYVFGLAKRLATGSITEDTVEVELRNKAKAKFGYLADDIDRGSTVKDILDSHIQQYANLMEVSPATVKFDDPSFRKFYEGVGEKGRRLMTLEESAQAVRSTEEWGNTKQAKTSASEFSESLLRTFGKVAS